MKMLDNKEAEELSKITEEERRKQHLKEIEKKRDYCKVIHQYSEYPLEKGNPGYQVKLLIDS